MVSLFKKIIGSRNYRLLKQYRKQVVQINALEPAIAALSDDELQAKTVEFRQRYADGKSLNSMLAEAFAGVREASRRGFGMRHVDVQMLGAHASVKRKNGRVSNEEDTSGKRARR